MSRQELGVAIIADPGRERTPVDAVLEMGWLLVAILVPLGINLWARQPFEPSKAALLRSLAWILTGLWLVDGLRRGRSPWRDLRGNPLLWPALAVAATQLLSTALAVDPHLSLWGSYERAQGALTLVSYVLLFLVVSARLRTVEQAQRLMMAMVATGVPLVVLGLTQALGRDPFGLVSDARSPIYTTLGRSNFTGAYLAMLLPLTLALAGLPARAGEEKRARSGGLPAWQWAAGGLVVAEVGVIGLTQARGAWLGAAVAVGTLALLYLWPRLGARWRRAVMIVGPAGLVGVLGGALWLGRQGGSEAARLAIWQATAGLIAQRPLRGYGPDSLGLVFPRVYPPQLVYYQGRGLAVDRAHNVLLDWTVAGGVLGLLAGVALLAAFFLAGVRTLRRAAGKRRLLLAACLAAVAGNVAANLVSFDVTATAAATWLLMALLPAFGEGIGKGGEEAQRPASGGGRQVLRWTAAGLLTVGIGAAIWQANVRPVAADIAALAADRQSARGDLAAAIVSREQAVALWPVEPVHREALSWDLLQQAQQADAAPWPWLEQAESELLAAGDLRPGDFQIWAALGELYGSWGNRWDVTKLPQADAAYRKATALAPNHALIYTAWGMVYQEGGQLAVAAAKFRQAVDLDATDGYAFAHLGEAELALGHVDEALAAYQQAVHWEPGLSYAHLGLARCYWKLGRQAAARSALDRALQLDPGNRAALDLSQQMGWEP